MELPLKSSLQSRLESKGGGVLLAQEDLHMNTIL